MGCFDIFCALCYAPYRGMDDGYLNDFDEKDIDKVQQIIENTEWMNKCVFLTVDDRIIHNCENDDCGGKFTDEKNNEYYHIEELKYRNFELKYMYGIFVHEDCWKYIKNTHNVELRYSHFPIIDYELKIHDKYYNPTNMYEGQDFNFSDFIKDGYGKYCMSPLKNPLVIKKVFTQLKIKNDKNRKSPESSASLYPENIYKVGKNGNIWQKLKGKWIPQETINTQLVVKTNAKLRIYRYVGETNFKPAFIKTATINGQNTKLDIITIKSNK